MSHDNPLWHHRGRGRGRGRYHRYNRRPFLEQTSTAPRGEEEEQQQHHHQQEQPLLPYAHFAPVLDYLIRVFNPMNVYDIVTGYENGCKVSVTVYVRYPDHEHLWPPTWTLQDQEGNPINSLRKFRIELDVDSKDITNLHEVLKWKEHAANLVLNQIEEAGVRLRN